MSAVSMVRCESYDAKAVRSAIRHSLDEVGGISRFVRPGDHVLLKPNLLSAHKPARHITTHPIVVRAVAQMVLEAGAVPFIGDSPALDSFQRVASKTGMSLVARELGIQVAELTDPQPVSLPEGTRFRRLELASQALKADAIISIPKLKTHSQMLLTLAVKNLFGAVVAQRKAEWHHMAGVDRDRFAMLHLDIYLALQPSLSVLDGVWGMEGHGPANGKPRPLGLIAASDDALALDFSVCQAVGIPLRSFPLYRAAHERGLGVTDPNRISYGALSPKDLSIQDFRVPRLDAVGMLPHSFDWFTNRYLVSRPVHMEGACTRCGQCAEICPADALYLEEKRVRFDYKRCIRCYCCQEVCPQDSIAFQKGLLVRLLHWLNR